MVGMSYQMPVSVGVIQGGGDTRFSMYMNMISTWGIVMPLSFLCGICMETSGGTGCGCSAVRSSCSRGFRYFYGLGAISGFTN